MPADAREPEGPRPVNARELQAVILEERKGFAFLTYRDGGGELRFVSLAGPAQVAIGRNPAADLCIGWDGEVSGLHAQVDRSADEFTLGDAGLSRNGSYVNGDRVHGSRRLQDGDLLRFGRTAVAVRIPTPDLTTRTVLARDELSAAQLSPQQRRVLTALCRPMLDSDPFATPATNQEIADELVVSVDAIKVHLRALFDKFDVAELPQNKKRLALVGRALQSGLAGTREPERP